MLYSPHNGVHNYNFMCVSSAFVRVCRVVRSENSTICAIFVRGVLRSMSVGAWKQTFNTSVWHSSSATIKTNQSNIVAMWDIILLLLECVSGLAASTQLEIKKTTHVDASFFVLRREGRASSEFIVSIDRCNQFLLFFCESLCCEVRALFFGYSIRLERKVFARVVYVLWKLWKYFAFCSPGSVQRQREHSPSYRSDDNNTSPHNRRRHQRATF